MTLVEQLPSPSTATDAPLVVEDTTSPAVLRGLAYGLPLALLLWFALGILVTIALR
jgi:hypothetical protein